MSFLENLGWRFTTKKFDPEKHLTEENLKKILRSMLEISAESLLFKKFNFGKHNGRKISEVVGKMPVIWLGFWIRKLWSESEARIMMKIGFILWIIT